MTGAASRRGRAVAPAAEVAAAAGIGDDRRGEAMRSRRHLPSVLALLALAVGCGAPPERARRPHVPVVSAPRAVAVPASRVEARIPTGARDVVSIVAAGGAVWVSSFDQRSLIEVDPRRNRVVNRLPVPGHPAQMLVYQGLLWALLPDEGLVAVVEPRARRIVRFIRSEPTCMTAMAFGEGALWLTDDRVEWSASRRDPRTGATLQTLPTARNWRCALAVAAGAVWAGTPGAVDRYDIEHNRLTARIDAGRDPLATLYAAGDELWTGNQDHGEMRRIDARTGRVTGVYRFGGGSLAADGADLWATSSLTTGEPEGTDPILVRLDRRTDRVVERLRVGRRARRTSAPYPLCPERTAAGACEHAGANVRSFALSGVAVAFGSVWVGQDVEGRLYRIAKDR